MSGGLWATTGKLVTAVSALALNALLTRLMPPDQVGAYFLIASIVAVGILFAQFGTQQAIVKLLGARGAEPDGGASRRAVRTGFVVVVAGICVVALLYVVFIGDWLGRAVFDSAHVAGLALLTAAWIALRSLQTFVAQVFRGFHRIGYASFFEGATTGVVLALALAFIWLIRGALSLEGVLLVTLAALLVTMVSGFYHLHRICAPMRPAPGLDIAGLLGVGLPLFVASIALQGAEEMHVWILGAGASEEEVAIYGAAFRLAKFVVVPLLVVNSVIPPMVAQLFAQGDTNGLERVLRLTATVASIPSIVIVAVLGLWGGPVLGVLFGEYYAQGATVLLVLLLAQTVNALTGSPGVLLSMSGHQAVVMRFALLSGVLGVATSAVLVRPLGGLGAAFGVAVGMVLHNVIMWMYCRRSLGIRTHMLVSGAKGALAVALKVYRARRRR